MRRLRSVPPLTGAVRAVQLRLPLAPRCEWHAQLEVRPREVPPCPRDAQVRVYDTVRDRRALCCTTHALTLVAMWRQTVPNRRRNAVRVTLAWLPAVSHRVVLPCVIGGRRRVRRPHTAA